MSGLRVRPEAGAGGELFVEPILRSDGTVAPDARCPMSDVQLLEALRLMIRSRLVDQRGISFQRQGRIGVFSEVRGQEGASTGSALALDPAIDWVVPAYRELPAMLRQGLPLTRYWMMGIGHPAGWVLPDDIRLLPLQIELGAQLPHAVGIGIGMRRQDIPGVAMAYFGDGASSEGDFYEAGNLAGLTGAPVVFFCQNNGWAISTPRAQQTGAGTIAAKAAAFGIPGYVVDGNDVMAVYAVTHEAVERARSGGGPTLIEAQTYRMGAHNTVDDPSRYCPDDEIERWSTQDPTERLYRHLCARGLWDAERDASYRSETLAEIDAALAEAESLAVEREPDMLFEHVYADLPPRLRRQRDRLRSGS